jgi:hypothetical protein
MFRSSTTVNNPDGDTDFAHSYRLPDSGEHEAAGCAFSNENDSHDPCAVRRSTPEAKSLHDPGRQPLGVEHDSVTNRVARMPCDGMLKPHPPAGAARVRTPPPPVPSTQLHHHHQRTALRGTVVTSSSSASPSFTARSMARRVSLPSEPSPCASTVIPRDASLPSLPAVRGAMLAVGPSTHASSVTTTNTAKGNPPCPLPADAEGEPAACRVAREAKCNRLPRGAVRSLAELLFADGVTKLSIRRLIFPSVHVHRTARLCADLWSLIIHDIPEFRLPVHISPDRYATRIGTTPSAQIASDHFRDPPVSLEQLVHVLLRCSPQAEPFAMIFALMYLEVLALAAQRRARAIASSPCSTVTGAEASTAIAAAAGRVIPYLGAAPRLGHHRLSCCGTTGVPTSPFTFDDRFPVTVLVSLYGLALTVHGDFAFSPGFFIRKVLPSGYSDAAVARQYRFTPLSVGTLNDYQLQVAEVFRWSLLVSSNQLASFLARRCTQEQRAYIVSLGEVF